MWQNKRSDRIKNFTWMCDCQTRRYTYGRMRNRMRRNLNIEKHKKFIEKSSNIIFLKLLVCMCDFPTFHRCHAELANNGSEHFKENLALRRKCEFLKTMIYYFFGSLVDGKRLDIFFNLQRNCFYLNVFTHRVSEVRI